MGRITAASVGCRRRHVRLLAGRTDEWHAFIVDGSGELGGHTYGLGRSGWDRHSSTSYHILDKCGIDAAVARPSTPPIQPDETFVGSAEESCVLEDRAVSDSGRWAKVAPLHAACASDAQDIVVCVIEAKQSGAGRLSPCGRRRGLLDCNTKYIFLNLRV